MELTAKFDGGFAGEPQTRAGTSTIRYRKAVAPYNSGAPKEALTRAGYKDEHGPGFQGQTATRWQM
jgi:hypothetical protein